MPEDQPSLQEQWMPDGTCFGCGPANEAGLRLRSFPSADGVAAVWYPEPHHAAYPGVLCGGVIGTLLDCHTGAALAWALNQRQGSADMRPVPYPFLAEPWATAEYSIRLHRPAPTRGAVSLNARTVRLAEDEAEITAELEAGGKVCSTCTAVWRRVKRRYGQ